LHISTNADGTVTYSFGVEAEAASHSPAALHTHAAATAAAAAVTVTAVPPNILEDTEATAGVAASAVQHTETAVAHLDKLLHITPSVAEVAALNGRSSSGNGASTSKNGSKPPHGHGHSNGNGNGNGAGYPPPPVLPLDTAAVNFSEPPAISILKLYSALCAAGRLDDALVVLKESMRAGREDVLRK